MHMLIMYSAGTDLELRDWLRRASESAGTPLVVRAVPEAALIACSTDYELLRPVLLELKRWYPEGLAHVNILRREIQTTLVARLALLHAENL
jgi:hypothetical protein